MLTRLLWLSLGTFLIGAESFLVAGVLPGIAADLETSLAACGQLITAYALAYAIGSPVLATLFGSAPRKTVLITAIAGFAVANGLAAASGSLPMLMVARVLLGLSAGLFIPTANAVAVAIVPPEMRGRALATVIGGMTVAIAVGAPLGTLLAHADGWRTPFWVVAGLSAVSAVALLFALPNTLPVGTASLAARLQLAAKPRVLKALLVTFFWSMSAFAVFTFVAPLLQSGGITGWQVSAAFFVFGVASAAGNAYGGIVVDRIGPVRTQAAVLSVLLVALLGLSFVTKAFAPPLSGYLIVTLFAVWGIAGWAFYPAQGARLVEVAPESPVVALSLNSSALFFGQASGASVASLALTVFTLTDLGWIGAACALMALVALRWSAEPRRVPMEAQ